MIREAIRVLHTVWLRMMMAHSLNCEAAYSKARSEWRMAIRLSVIDGEDPTRFQSAAAICETLIAVEQDVQRCIRSQMITLGYRPELLP